VSEGAFDHGIAGTDRANPFVDRTLGERRFLVEQVRKLVQRFCDEIFCTVGDAGLQRVSLANEPSRVLDRQLERLEFRRLEVRCIFHGQ
jgi:hypothetical protein